MKLLTLFAALAFFAAPGFAADQAASDDGSPRRTPLEAGEPAPDFTLPSSDGQTVHLAAFKGKSTVVLYFYPKDFTPGCTKEAQDFRDDFDRFKKAGAVVLGVSVDDMVSHKQFVTKMNLNFPVLADVGGNVSRTYGVMGWIMARRVTYVIGRDGKIKAVFPEVDVNGHSKAVLKAVQDLSVTKAQPPAPKSKRGKGSGPVPTDG